jgi:hypothetical protein
MGMMRRLRMLPAAAVSVAVLASGCVAANDSQTSPGNTASSGSDPTSARVQVEVNHCFVEPVSFDGVQWNVPFKEQFGWGGMEPKHWMGTGTMVRTGQYEARFEDDGGATLVFRPVDHPSVRPVEKALCR